MIAFEYNWLQLKILITSRKLNVLEEKASQEEVPEKFFQGVANKLV